MIAPLILVFSTICSCLLWILYRLYPLKLAEVDPVTYRYFYPTTIRQLFTGIYFMELSLAGLFFLVRDANDKAACTAQAAVIIVATVFTALFHYTLDHSGWIHWLPLPDVLKQKID